MIQLNSKVVNKIGVIKINLNRKAFPYSKIRDQQRKILNTIDRNWDKKYIVIEAPPGIGKSGIAMTLLGSVDKGFLITSTKQLQDQYMNDFYNDVRYDLESIKGKSSYICTLNDKITCNFGECLRDEDVMKECIYSGLCPYYTQRADALNAKITLTSYSYFLTFADTVKDVENEYKKKSKYSAGKWSFRDMIVFDEAHLLESQIISWAGIELIPSGLNKKFDLFDESDIRDMMFFSQPLTESGFEANKHWIMKLYDLICKKVNYYVEDIKSTYGKDVEVDEEFLTQHKELSEVQAIKNKIKNFLRECQKDWLVEPIEGGLSLTPLNIGKIFKEYIDHWGTEKIVFISASVVDKNMFLKSLDIKESEALFIKAKSEFDPSKSPIILTPAGKMGYKDIDNTMPKIAEKVKQIMNENKGKKGIIHSGNYKINNYLEENINTNRFITRAGNYNNEQMIRTHEMSLDDTILLSPSLTTGVDLKDDLGRFSIIVKLPWPNVGDPRVKAKMEQDEDWLAIEMLKTLIQTCGRTTRSENDWSNTYILDQSFGYWIFKYRDKLDSQFLKRIKWNTN